MMMIGTNEDGGQEQDDQGTFCFPSHNSPPDLGACFSEWIGLTDDDFADDICDDLYAGSRAVLEHYFRRHLDLLLNDFAWIPTDSKWIMQRVQGVYMPVLEDTCHRRICMLPTSAECDPIVMPDPYHQRVPPPTSDYMTDDVWFEYCQDGGMYCLGIDDTVLIMYVDGPGDMIYGRYKCSYDQWKQMWDARDFIRH